MLVGALSSSRRALRDPIRNRAALKEIGKGSTGRLRDVDERSEGSRREERIARTKHEPAAAGGVFTEPPDERRLADAGLSADEHDSPRAGRRLGECCMKGRERVVAFEEFPDGGERTCDGAHGVIVLSTPAMQLPRR